MLLENLQSEYPECIGTAAVNDTAQQSDFIGPCFFAQWLGSRYRIDTKTKLADDLITEISDFIQTIPPPADWKRFAEEIPADILGVISQSPLATMIVSRLTRLADGEVEWDGNEDRLIQLWNQATPSLNEAQREQLTILSTELYIPIVINETNLISASMGSNADVGAL